MSDPAILSPTPMSSSQSFGGPVSSRNPSPQDPQTAQEQSVSITPREKAVVPDLTSQANKPASNALDVVIHGDHITNNPEVVIVLDGQTDTLSVQEDQEEDVATQLPITMHVHGPANVNPGTTLQESGNSNKVLDQGFGDVQGEQQNQSITNGLPSEQGTRAKLVKEITGVPQTTGKPNGGERYSQQHQFASANESAEQKSKGSTEGQPGGSIKSVKQGNFTELKDTSVLSNIGTSQEMNIDSAIQKQSMISNTSNEETKVSEPESNVANGTVLVKESNIASSAMETDIAPAKIDKMPAKVPVSNEEKRGEKRPLQIRNQLEPQQSIKKIERNTDTVDPKRRRTEADSTPQNANQLPSSGAKVPDNSRSSGVGAFRTPPSATTVTSTEPVKSVSKPSRPPVGGGTKPIMLRSSPVIASGDIGLSQSIPRRPAVPPSSAPSSTSTASPIRGVMRAKLIGRKRDAMDVDARRVKSVSWAPDNQLVNVKYIDTRKELLRSWDPESEITLPFTPNTLDALRRATAEEDRSAASNRQQAAREISHGGMYQSGVSRDAVRISFEAARKKELDMEQERARRAREDLQRKLNEMQPKRQWRRPYAIILPAECRGEPEAAQKITLYEENQRALLRKREATQNTPSSPPPGLRIYEENGAGDQDVPLFPLTDYTTPQEDSMDAPNAGNAYGLHIPSSDPMDYSMHNRYEHVDRGMNGIDVQRPDPSRGHNVGYDRHGRINRNGNIYRAPQGDISVTNGQAAPRKTVHALLSALRTSGLLKKKTSPQGVGKRNDRAGNRMQHPEMSGGYNSGFDDHRGVNHREREDIDRGYHSGRYRDDERHRGLRDEDLRQRGGMMAGNGMGNPHYGHPGQMGAGFGAQGGMMDGYGFVPPMPPMGMAPMGMHPMGMVPMAPPMGVPPVPYGMGAGPMVTIGKGNKSGGKSKQSATDRGRVETITRPKSKGSKQRKRCKYFGTKQGCRDGNSCIYSHN